MPGTVFVSHKTSDASIGKIIADFLREESGNRVQVFFSSDPQFQTPRGGRTLDDELTEAIGQAGVLLLVYTGMSQHVDWSYCIYETSYAASRGVPVYVFQCASEAPAPLKHLVRISVANEADIRKFVIDYLTAPDFFGGTEAVTNFAAEDEVLKQKAKSLHEKLNEEVRKLSKSAREWTQWPNLRLTIDSASVEAIIEHGLDLGARRERVRKCLEETAVIKDSKAVDRVFGVGIDDGDLFSRVVSQWKLVRNDQSLAWYEALVDQIWSSLGRSFQPLRDERIREAMSDTDRLPVVTRSFTYPNTSTDLDILFLGVAERSPLVREAMIARDDMYLRVYNGGFDDNTSVRDIYTEMRRQTRYRLPVLDSEGKVLYMVHRSMIGDFISDHAVEGQSIGELSFSDMLDSPETKATFETTFVFAKPEQTVDEALKILKDNPKARDIFVTETGDRDAPVLGMLTSTDVVEKV